MALAGHDTANLVFNNAATASSYSGTLAGVAAGELIVACITACADGVGTDPSGWTVTLGGDTLTFRAGPAPTTSHGTAAIFTGVASASGNQTLAVSPGVNLRACTAHAFRITGFDTTAPIPNSDPASSYSSDASALTGPNGVTTAADGNAVIGCIGIPGGDTTALAVGAADGSTVGQSGSNAFNDHEWGVAWQRTPTKASVTFGWTWSSNPARPGLAWVEVAESAGGGSIGSGAGSASGAGTATGTGAATASASGSAAGSAAASATGAGIAAAAASSSGIGAAAATGAARAASAAVSAGVAAASATGASIATATGSAAGTSAATAYSGAGSAGSAAGTSAASGVGAAVVSAAGVASGAAVASASGARIVAASGSASGASGASAVGRSFVAAVAAAGGSGIVLGAGAATLAAVASAAGSAVASGITGAVQQISNIIMASRRLPAFRAVGGRGGIRAIGGGR